MSFYMAYQVLSALKEGTAALNKLHEEMSVDDVEELLNETKEAIEVFLYVYAYLSIYLFICFISSLLLLD